MDLKTLYAMAGETAKEVEFEIWVVINAQGEVFEVSGERAAREWVAREGGTCRFTGRYEAPSIT